MTTKISELTSATAIADADEYVINQSGTTKKFSGMAFEEGTWTPTLGVGTGGAFSGISFSSTDGYYQRHGNIVRCHARLNITGGTGSISASDYFVIDDASLPFTPNLPEVSTGLIFSAILTARASLIIYLTTSPGIIVVADTVTGSPSPNNFCYLDLTYEVA